MLRYIAVSVVLALSLAAPSLWDKEWSVFKETHSKQYSQGEEPIRRAIWESNVKMIQQHNLEADRGVYSYRLGMNHLGDMTDKERKAMNGYRMSAKKVPLTSTFAPPSNVDDLPSEVNWTTKGYVTPVKLQGKCGACWSFSATGSLEGQHFKKTGKLVSLSEQNLMDCSRSYGNSGCDGGLMDNAFNYIRWNGVDTEQSYPYTGKNGSCQFRSADMGATLIGWADTPVRNETILKAAVAAVGPVSVAIDAGLKSFTFYKSGVYYDAACSSGFLDHGVLVVGYGTTTNGSDYWLVKNRFVGYGTTTNGIDYWVVKNRTGSVKVAGYGTTTNGIDYWLVKNSWGTQWGMDGYIMMSRNRDNNCGIATMASYPIV